MRFLLSIPRSERQDNPLLLSFPVRQERLVRPPRRVRVCISPRKPYNASSGVKQKSPPIKTHSFAAGDCPHLAAKPSVRQSLRPLFSIRGSTTTASLVQYVHSCIAVPCKLMSRIGRRFHPKVSNSAKVIPLVPREQLLGPQWFGHCFSIEEFWRMRRVWQTVIISFRIRT
jgi:hypothetical protein